MNKKILITGGAGFIGSSLINYLIKKGYKIINIDNLSNNKKYKIIKKSDFYKIDITNEKKLEKVFKYQSINTVFHLAAKLNISESQNNKFKYMYNNYSGTKILVNLCKKYNIKNFIFASSCSVYGSSNIKIKETKKLNPCSNYAKSKKESEHYIIKKFSNSNTRYAILRYFNVVGANLKDNIGELSDNDHVIKNFCKQLYKKKPIFKIYGSKYKTISGTCIRDYLFIDDLNYIHYKILKLLNIKKKTKLIINCGTSKGYSVFDLYKKLKNKINNHKLLFLKKRKGDVAKAVADISELRKIVGIKYKFKNIDYILRNSCKWEKYLEKLSIKN